MTDHVDASPTKQPERHTTDSHPVRLVAFAVLSVGFLVWILFGTVEARVWVSGRLNFMDKPIAGLWQYLADNLPALPAPGLFTVLVWISMAVVVFGTIVGLWLFLGTDDHDPQDESWESIHASHLNNDSE